MAKQAFEEIKAWDGTGDNGAQARAKIKRNFDRVNDAIEELTADTAAGQAITAAEAANAATEAAPKTITLLAMISISTLPDALGYADGTKIYSSFYNLVYTRVVNEGTGTPEWSAGEAPRLIDSFLFASKEYKYLNNAMRPSGRGIISNVRTAGNGAAGTTDTYTITYSDGTTSTYTVTNGANGTGATLEQVRSQSTGNVPSSKLLDDELNKTNRVFVPLTWTDNLFIQGDGASGSYTGQSISNYIAVFPGRKINIKTISIAGTNIAFYDVNKVFISAISSPLTLIEQEISVPSNAYFARYTVTTTNKSNSFVTIFLAEISSYIKDLEASISNSLSKVICKTGDNIFPEIMAYTDNYFLTSAGVPSSHTDYSITDFIECGGNKTYQVNKSAQYGYIAFYDANKVLISAVGDIATNNYNFTTPQTAKYFKTTIKKANKGTIIINYTGADFAKESIDTINDILNSLAPLNISISTINAKLAKLTINTNDNIIPAGITFTNGYYLGSNGAENMYGSSPGNTYSITDYVVCNANQAYRLNKKADYAYICFYNSNKVFLSSVGQLSADNYNFTTPAGCSYMRVTVLIANQATFTVINTGLAYNPVSKDVYTAITDSLTPINNSIVTINAKLAMLIITTNDNIVPAGITFTNGYYLGSNGAENMFGPSPGNTYSICDYIECKGNQAYRLNKKADYAYIAFYNSSKVFLSVVGPLSTDNYNFTTHAEAKYMRVSVLIANQATFTVINTGATYIKGSSDSGTTSSASSITPVLFGNSKLGCVDFQQIIPNGYNHIIFNGQSLSTGDVTMAPISTVPVTDCYMIGTTPRSVIGSFTGLVGAISGNSAEPPTVGAVNALKKRINKTLFKDAKFIGTSVGTGGTVIEVQSKECTSTPNQTVEENLYHTRFLVALATAKANAGATPIVCPAIVWMQGEANQDPNNYGGLTPGSYQTHDKATYKALLKLLKNNMQADVMSVYGQTQKPLFFVYQTSASYTFSNFEIPITQAQYELAMEEDDVILLNPHYHVPNAYNGGGHLNANGSRWYGELCAKTIYDVLINDSQFNPVLPKRFQIDGSDIYIHCYVPCPPLVIDTKTLQAQTNYGFAVKKDNVLQSVVSVEIIGGTCIKLHMGASMATGTIVVSYAGTTQSGRGNIRDSDANLSFANYVDDTSIANNVPPYTPVDANNTNYYNKKYPLWNWLSNFYLTIQ